MSDTRRAIYGKLAGDGTLAGLLGTPAQGYTTAVYYQQAAHDADYPYLIFQKQSGTPTYAFDTDPALVSEVWLMKGVDRSDSADGADAIQGRLKELLNDGALTISGEVQMYLRWESDVDYSETTDGQRYVHAGSLFRLVYEKAP